ncbi:MAG: nicotinate-nucleotide diphosphorylase (carboxylating), partial [Alphaproteobacteria bacterium]|nr:nicotinate-nucleotide diphosphorylase (carboxylating) [Alphaproteobacteria bacterium]
MTDLPELPSLLITDAVRAALREDLGRAGDITSAATIPSQARADAVFGARKEGVLSGLALAEAAFREIDPSVAFTQLK